MRRASSSSFHRDLGWIRSSATLWYGRNATTVDAKAHGEIVIASLTTLVGTVLANYVARRRSR
jgi:hypothetical protein